MKKLKLIKTSSNEGLKQHNHSVKYDIQLFCQIDVPGIGRFRTGKIHEEFHFTYSKTKNANIVKVNKNIKKKTNTVKV
jgi:hypothetical protein